MFSLLHRNSPFEALEIFRHQVSLHGAKGVNEVTISVALKACRGRLNSGCQIHGFAVCSGFDSYVTVSNSLMSLYCKGEEFDQAVEIFESLRYPDTVSWNTVLSGFKLSDDAVEFACRMNSNGVVFDFVTYTTVFGFCSDLPGGFHLGVQLHSLVVQSGFEVDNFVGNALITMYSKCGRLVDSAQVFAEMLNKDGVSWNALLSGYTQDGNYGVEAIRVFVEMVKEGMRLDHVSFSSVVASCGNERRLEIGRQVHGLVLRSGYETHVLVCNILIAMYSKCGIVHDANMVFKGMVERNVISWTTMISINEDNAVCLFHEMILNGVYPNEVTFVGLIHAISNNKLMREGQMIHGLCRKTNFTSELIVSNSLITMYAKFEAMEDSRKLFDELSTRVVISWNSLISGYAQNRLYEEALETFLLAIAESYPDQYTFGSILSVIASAEHIPLKQGQRCHSRIIKLGLNTDPIVSSALLDMYAKRGNIHESKRVFEETAQKSLVAWTSIISAHARHSDYESVMVLFEEMKKECVEPDPITFLALFASCSRSGMVDMGIQIFDSMIKEHHIEPTQEHYSCMVDMLGRAGRLEEAEKFMGRMHMKPGLSMLQSLLGACKMHGHVDLGIKVGEALMQMEPSESGSYVLMSNMHAEKGDWEKVAKIRRGMRYKGVKKEVGFSWVDVGDVDDSMYMHGFSSSDTTHPQAKEIYKMVECIGSEMQFFVTEENNCDDALQMEGSVL
ncbi:hypothetical protein GIB67_037377 [Kingdonia uniflora]|uniref:Pentatricopeptide repeat-containing protein n=1 Tax=Kingdonia uniflora TaxID=39325 RepID=A0A7J7M8G4_9MAGN|nr:hypothetical protein GIB67_037377 [Kingdonia uniflora]